MTKEKSAVSELPKLFVLDTNIYMHDPMCIFRFKEHDIFVPGVVLQELDDHKKGTTEISHNVRKVMRFISELLESSGKVSVSEGISLALGENRGATGRLCFETEEDTRHLPEGTAGQKPDDQILAIVGYLRASRKDRDVILVSKDLNIRIKARVKGIPSEDYENDNVLEDSDVIPSSIRTLSIKDYRKLMMHAKVHKQDRHEQYRLSGRMVKDLALVQNECLIVADPSAAETPLFVEVVAGTIAILRTLTDYTKQKNQVFGLTAKNIEQSIALNFLMDPDIDFVTLLGQAGTGKTLLTIAAALEQVVSSHLYNQIIMTRATVPIGEEIGFLPGNEEEKMSPWMGALDDNLQFLLTLQSEERGQRKERGRQDSSVGQRTPLDLMRSRIDVKSLSFMRGRTFINRFLIVDEGQNLTPKQFKTIITRAGPGTKVVCLGNVAQIDTPYLTEGNAGITFAVAKFRGWKHHGHVTLVRGERSRLADYATQVM